MPADHPLFVGNIGMHGGYETGMATDNADVIIACGARFSDRVAGDREKFGQQATIIQLDIDAHEIHKNVKVDNWVIGDLKDTLVKVVDGLEQKSNPTWIEQIMDWKKKITISDINKEGYCHPYQILDEMNKIKSREDIVATDVGQHQMWVAQRTNFFEPRTFLTSGGLGTMGFGMGAAQQTLKQLGESTSGAALSCAVTYPLGVVGVILAIIVVKKLFVRPADMEQHEHEDPNHTYIATFQVHNPAIYNKSIQDLVHISTIKFVISRLWRNGQVSIPTSEKILKEHDRLLVITTEKDVQALTILFGEQEKKDWNKEDIDWNAIDSELISKHIVISRPEINGKKLGSLRLRNTYGINISRVLRSGVQLLATPELVLQLGDRLTVVGEAAAIKNVEKVLGNTVKTLKDPNLASIFIGIVLGLIVGSIPIAIPGISSPVKLGLAGGPIIAGIVIGSYGPRLHLVTYTTRSASLMLRGIGLSLYLACLGLDSGVHFFDTVMRPEGALWIGIGFLITFIPVVIMALVALRLCKMDFGNTCGMLCGSMANPMALNYANDIIPNDNPAISYATVYPLGMFIRVIIAQLILMIFL